MKPIQLITLFSILISVMSCGADGSSKAAKVDNSHQKTYKPSVKTSLGLILPDLTVKSGDEVCMDVKVKDFEKIVSIQHSVNWDPKVVTLTKVLNFKLKGLAESNFGLNYIDKGAYGFSWYDPSVKGITLPDQSPIYTICFKAIGSSGSSTPIRFSGDPVTIEVSNSQERVLGIPTGNGKITIQ